MENKEIDSLIHPMNEKGKYFRSLLQKESNRVYMESTRRICLNGLPEAAYLRLSLEDLLNLGKPRMAWGKWTGAGKGMGRHLEVWRPLCAFFWDLRGIRRWEELSGLSPLSDHLNASLCRIVLGRFLCMRSRIWLCNLVALSFLGTVGQWVDCGHVFFLGHLLSFWWKGLRLFVLHSVCRSLDLAECWRQGTKT